MILLARVSTGKMAVRRISIDRRGKLARQPRQKLVLRQAGLLLQCGQHVRPDRLLQLRWRKLLVRPLVDPGLRGIALTILLEAFEQFAQAAVQQGADAASGERAAEIAEQAAQRALLGSAGG